MNEFSKESLILQTNYEVTSADTDMFGRLRPGALANFLVQSAIKSADSLGFGYKGLHSHELFWVFSRITVEIYKPMQWYDTATVETWPKDVDGLLYLRDFVVYNQHRELIAKCTSGWLAVDRTTKKPKVLEGRDGIMFSLLRDKHAISQHPPKLPPVAEGSSREIRSTYFDLDLNRHVTSTRYIDWMMDSFAPDFHRQHYPSRILLNYMKETMYDELISLKHANTGDTGYSFEGFHSPHGTTKFRGLIEFAEQQ